MRGRNKADVVAAALLQLKHYLGEAFMGHLVFLLLTPCLRDLIILAIDAAEIAVAEKDVARAFCARQTRLLAKMCSVRRHDRQPTGVAGGDLVRETVIAAIFRAYGAGREHCFESLDAGP